MPTQTLTGLIPVIYQALDKVSRERIGFTNAVAKDVAASGAAVGQTITTNIAIPQTATDATPAAFLALAANQTATTKNITISKDRHVTITWSGEEIKAAGPNYETVLQGQIQQAFRALANEIENDLALVAIQNASRAYGTAGTTPFGTAADLSDIAGVREILDVNGADEGNLALVGSNATFRNLRGKQSVLFKVNEAGTSDLLRNGVIGRLEGFDLFQSGASNLARTKGTGASYLVNNVGTIVLGGTTIAADTGTGTILAGDIVTFAADTVNKYVVNTALSGGSFAIGAPGAEVVIPDNNAITVGNSYTANVAFDKSAIQLVTRPPVMGNDNAVDVIYVTDPISGITFSVAWYKGFRASTLSIGVVWGVAAIKSDNIAILLG
jgi:hypothetical protein